MTKIVMVSYLMTTATTKIIHLNQLEDTDCDGFDMKIADSDSGVDIATGNQILNSGQCRRWDYQIELPVVGTLDVYGYDYRRWGMDIGWSPTPNRIFYTNDRQHKRR